MFFEEDRRRSKVSHASCVGVSHTPWRPVIRQPVSPDPPDDPCTRRSMRPPPQFSSTSTTTDHAVSPSLDRSTDNDKTPRPSPVARLQVLPRLSHAHPAPRSPRARVPLPNRTRSLTLTPTESHSLSARLRLEGEVCDGRWADQEPRHRFPCRRPPPPFSHHPSIGFANDIASKRPSVRKPCTSAHPSAVCALCNSSVHRPPQHFSRPPNPQPLPALLIARRLTLQPQLRHKRGIDLIRYVRHSTPALLMSPSVLRPVCRSFFSGRVAGSSTGPSDSQTGHPQPHPNPPASIFAVAP